MLNFQIRRPRQRSRLLHPAITAPLSAAAGLVTGYVLFRRRPGAVVPKGSGKRVDQAMTRDPRSIAPSTPVAEAAQVMRTEEVGAVPVVDQGRLVGMLTDRDIATRLVAEGRDGLSTTAVEVASGELVTVRPEQDLDTALQLMAQFQVRRLPVVADDRLVGIVAQADVANAGNDRQTGEVVERISKANPPAAG
jgi:CBS domain-containing protein